MSSLYFPFCAVMISILITIIFFTKKSIKNTETKAYSCLVLINLVESIIACIIVLVSKLIGTVDYLYILNRIDYILIFTWVWMLFVYILNLSLSGKDKLIKIILNISFVLNILFYIGALFCNFSIINYADVLNTSGIATDIITSGCAFYLILIMFCVVYSFINRSKNFSKRKYIPLAVFIIFGIIALTIREYNPTILVESILMAYVNLIMYFTIENPDVKSIEKLNMAKDEAEKANRAKSDFLSSMSHEIRTPLNAIVGFSEAIQSSTTLEDAKTSALDVIEASNVLLEIVNGVLDISKIELGKVEINEVSYDSQKLFMDVSNLVKHKAAEKALDFQVLIAPDIPKALYGDKTNLKKVIANVLGNAVKYTERGFVKYTVNAVRKNDVCRLIISVEDSGRGIKKENIDKMFTRFQRLDEDRNTTIEGTGLGLAITKHILELMGGQIVVQSVYGSGSKFTITLDQKITYETNLQSTAELSTLDLIDEIDLTGRKILVVDDNLLNLKVASKFLESYHPTIESVSSGFECLEKIENGMLYDLILMDDMMPKMSGVETLQKLMDRGDFSIPVVVLTANAVAGEKEKYLKLGFHDYLAKPIDKKELRRVLFRFLNKNKVVEKKEESKSLEFQNIDSSLLEKSSDTVIVLDGSSLNISDDFNHLKEAQKLDYLRNNNISIDSSIGILGDIQMYNDTVKEFLNGISERIDKLNQFSTAQDLRNYAIEVHALKSDAKYLGLLELSEIAFQCEQKSKQNQIQFINSVQPELVKVTQKYIHILKKYLD